MYGGRENLEAIAVPPPRERGRLRRRLRASMTIAEESTSLAAGVAADLSRRPRLRLQVEHGLDARHARLHAPRPRPPQVPPRPAHLRDALRLVGELRPAALPRRGRARQGLAPRPRCRATTGSASPTCACSTPSCGPTPARSSCSWAGEFGQSRRVEPRPEPRLAPARRAGRTTARCAQLVRDLNRLYRAMPALHQLDADAAGFSMDRLRRLRAQSVVCASSASAATGTISWSACATSRRSSARATASGVPRPGY